MKKGTKKESAKGTLHYRDYSNNERKMMQKYVRTKGWTDLWHWNNWVKVEWIDDPKKNVDWMGVDLKTVFSNEQKNEKT